MLGAVVGGFAGLFLQAWYEEADSKFFRSFRRFVKGTRLRRLDPPVELVFQMRPGELDALRSQNLSREALMEAVKASIAAASAKVERELSTEVGETEIHAKWFDRDYVISITETAEALRAFEYLAHPSEVVTDSDIIMMRPAEGVSDFLLTVGRQTSFKGLRAELHDIVGVSSQLGAHLASVLGIPPSLHLTISYPRGFALKLGPTEVIIQTADLEYPDGVAASLLKNKMLVSYPFSSKHIPLILETLTLYSK